MHDLSLKGYIGYSSGPKSSGPNSNWVSWGLGKEGDFILTVNSFVPSKACTLYIYYLFKKTVLKSALFRDYVPSDTNNSCYVHVPSDTNNSSDTITYSQITILWFISNNNSYRTFYIIQRNITLYSTICFHSFNASMKLSEVKMLIINIFENT